MFAAIAPSYDLNNRLHSFWRDQAWRRQAVKIAELCPSDVVVDVACGTGDLTLAFWNQLCLLNRTSTTSSRLGPSPRVIGVDFTFEMLPPARVKSQLPGTIQPPVYLNGDATNLPLPDASCDAVSIAFGIRNVQEPQIALREFRRILKPGGRVVILEFSEPTNPLLRAMNRFYTGRVMPLTATLISGDRSGAYKYLPRSIGTFWTREQMVQMLVDAGFEQITQHPMTFGVCVCYRGVVSRIQQD